MSPLIADDPSAGHSVTAPPSTVLAGADWDWADLLAIGIVADDLTPTGIARYAGVPFATALAALERARTEGAVADDGSIESRTRTQLVAQLTAQRVAEVHAAVARRVLSGSPDDLRAGLAHLRDAVAAMPTAELVELAEHAGRFALDIRDAQAARDLLLLALEHDLGTDLRLEAERNLALARALLLLGDSTGAQARLMRTVLLAEECGDGTIAARAAERFALPADWQAGDPRVAGMIDRVLAMPTLGDEERTRMLAVRGWVESRLPVAQAEGQQVSWVSRPTVARPLAEEALAASVAQSSATRLLALLAWRHTHRAPQYLDERRRVSEEAVALAERIGAEAELVEAAVMLAVDALEAGDRPAHRMALTTAGAVADRSGDERLRWRALVPAAGIALMDDDVDTARAIAGVAFAAGHASNAPGLLASEWAFTGQLAARHADPGAIATSFAADAATLATSPLGRSGLALLLARDGRKDVASAHAWATLHQLDEESSLLLTLARLADVTVALEDPELAEELTALLAPWSGRVVVDANGWWCDGPVDLWLAELALLRRGVIGDRQEDVVALINGQLDAATRLAQATGDRRSLGRIVAARDRIPGAQARASISDLGLTARELEVLHGLALGETYTRIAARLRYSVSTVRNDAVSVYRKLEVSGRSEAAARAVGLGLEVRRRSTRGRGDC
jgi:DNA-binding CsgD family transcriptional regulator